MTKKNRSTRGFTLLEVLIAVLIVGIIATVALPMLGSYTEKAREAREDANMVVKHQAQQRYEQDHKAGLGLVYDPDASALVEYGMASSRGPSAQLLLPTDSNGNVMGDPIGASPGPFIYGPYLAQLPPEPASVLLAMPTFYQGQGEEDVIIVPPFAPAGADLIFLAAGNVFVAKGGNAGKDHSRRISVESRVCGGCVSVVRAYAGDFRTQLPKDMATAPGVLRSRSHGKLRVADDSPRYFLLGFLPESFWYGGPYPVLRKGLDSAKEQFGFKIVDSSKLGVVLSQPVRDVSRPLDLASAKRNFISYAVADIGVGEAVRHIERGSMITSAEALAVQQVIKTGTQRLVLGTDGSAIGGAFQLTSMEGVFSDAMIPDRVTAIFDVNETPELTFEGTLTVAGRVVVMPSMSTRILDRAVINAETFVVLPGATIATASTAREPQQNPCNLCLNAVNNLINQGTIASASTLTITAGGSIMNANATGVMQAVSNIIVHAPAGSFVNSGVIQSTTALSKWRR